MSFVVLSIALGTGCVTFREILEENTQVNCPSDNTITGGKDACTSCERICPSDSPVGADCVVHDYTKCPVQKPATHEECVDGRDAESVCYYEPYCSEQGDSATAERCVFLTRAECYGGQWIVSMESAPQPSAPPPIRVVDMHQSSCVTFREILEENTQVNCASDHTITGDKDACASCERICPSDSPVGADCVVYDYTPCPVNTPATNERCAWHETGCNYAPYCSRQIISDDLATAERCVFLTRAECNGGLWAVSTESGPSPMQVTCGDVRRSFIAQECCDDESLGFDVDLI